MKFSLFLILAGLSVFRISEAQPGNGPNPHCLGVFIVNGGGTYCYGEPGPTVTLSNSETGVTYQLMKNGSNDGSPLAGTGSELVWSNKTSGYYTVVATHTSSDCVLAMNSSATVSTIGETTRRFLIDFGNPAFPTTMSDWNNVANSVAGTQVNLNTTEGCSSEINISITQAATNGYDGNGNQFNSGGYEGAVLGYPASACRDSHFSYLTGGTYKLTGLLQDRFYTIRIFGTRAANATDRVGTYTFNKKQKQLNAANNTSQTVVFHHLRPTAEGELILSFGVAPGSQFGYMNVMDITENVVPGIAAPSALTVQFSSTNAQLTWTDNSNNEQGFRIERKLSSQNVFEVVAQVAANTTEYTDVNLAPGNYEYRVFAFHATEESPYSSEVSLDNTEPEGNRRFLIDFGDPSLQTSAVGWNNMSNSATGTKIYLATTTGSSSNVELTIVKSSDNGYGGAGNQFNSGGHNGIVLDYPVSSCIDSHYSYLSGGTYKLSGLNPGLYYSVRIFGSRAIAAADRVGTYTINGKRLTLNAAQNTSQTVVFNYLKPNPQGELVFDFGVATGSTFGYINVMDVKETAVPSIVEPLSLEASVNNLTITLNWTDQTTNETGFRIERRVAGTSELFEEVGQVGANVASFSQTVAANAVGYEYRVFAFKSDETSAYSNSATTGAITENLPPLFIPVDLVTVREMDMEWVMVSVTDEDDDVITFSIENGPGFVWTNYVDARRTLLAFEPYEGDEGEYEFLLHADDSRGARATITIKVKVNGRLRQTLDNLAFQYRYDARRRMTHKKVPGADWVYMVYDNRDRLVMTQDGEQRKSNKWRFTKYDALNRPILTGIYTHNANVDQGEMSGLISTTNFYETFSGAAGTASSHGYTNNVFPKLNDTSYQGSLLEILTVTYYDNYDFKSLLATEFNYKPHEVTAATRNGISYPQPETEFLYVKGLVTGTKTMALGQGNYLCTVNYYDDKYRVVQAVSNDAEGSIDRTTNIYDFVGTLLKTKTTHTDYSIKWTNLVGTAVDAGNTLYKTNSEGWNAAANSEQVLPAGEDGWMEVTVSETTKARRIGLTAIPNNSFTDFNYSFLLTPSSVPIRVMENGAQIATPVSTWRSGDVLRIERTGTTVRYKINGQLVHPSQLTSNTALMIRASLNSGYHPTTGYSTLKDVRASFAARTSSVERTFDYDHAGRLTKTWHSVNEEPKVLLAFNEYNELGQLVTKKLYDTNPPETVDASRQFKQHVDYRYNIRGWLTRVNDADLDVVDQGPRDLFGMNLMYNESVPSLTNEPAFNGNISALKWSSNLGLGFNSDEFEIFDPKQRAYTFKYDTMNRLKGASHHTLTTSWNPSPDFQENIPKYDLNGNIRELQRKGVSGAPMDLLDYTYNGNQLLKVDDNSDNPEGFTDGSNPGNDYSYDANGNMIFDRNKSIATITYNYLNLPEKVTKTSGEYIRYTYDATGRKLSQSVYNSSNLLQKKTDYAGEFFYENDTLKFINHEEGRVVMTGDEPEYQYHLKDHLGNVRTTFTTTPTIDEYNATLEVAHETAERADFPNYNDVFISGAEAYNHTAEPGATHSVLLNGAEGYQIGLTKSLRVVPGDTIDMKAYAKYFIPSPDGQPSVGTAIAAAMTSAFGLSSSSTGLEYSAFESLNTIFDEGWFIGAADWEDDDAPKAYLNYILFDEDFIPYDMGWDQIDAHANATSPHDTLKLQAIARKPGYVYIYFSNEDDEIIHVYFDDLNIKHIHSPVVQADDYYPFGLTFNSYSRENSTAQNFKYNGVENEDELGLNINTTFFRMHDPAIGRWWQVDPKPNHAISLYAAMDNNPIKYSDPLGDTVKFDPGVSKRFIRQFNRATTKLIEKGVGGHFNQLQKSKQVYIVKEVKGDKGSYFDPKKNEIGWNSKQGMITNSAKTLSPATLLNHEFDHAAKWDRDPKGFTRDGNTLMAGYGNKEEERVIKGSEQRTAREMGEIGFSEVTRTDHFGTLFPMKNSTSTELDESAVITVTGSQDSSQEQEKDDENE